MNKRRTKALLKKLKPIVCEECHQASSQAYNQIFIITLLIGITLDLTQCIHFVSLICLGSLMLV